MRGVKAFDQANEAMSDLIEALGKNSNSPVDVIDFGARVKALYDRVERLHKGVDGLVLKLAQDFHVTNGKAYKSSIVAYDREGFKTKELKASVPESVWKPFVTIQHIEYVTYKPN